MAKKKNRVPKSGPVWKRTAEQATLDRMPKYNAHACKTGAHGDAKYNRARYKSSWQREMSQEGTRNRGFLPFFAQKRRSGACRPASLTLRARHSEWYDSAMTARDDAYEDLMAAVSSIGFPQDLGMVLAGELRGEKSMRRMAAYLRAARPKTMEEIADEMIAIIEQRDTWVKKKIAEHARSSFNEFLNRDSRDSE